MCGIVSAICSFGECCRAALCLALLEDRCRDIAARRLRPGESLRGAAAAAGHGDGSVAAAGDTLSGGDRQCCGGEFRRSGGAGFRLHSGDQLPGRRAGQERRAPVHDRARALQGQARSGEGCRGWGPLGPEAGADGIRASGRTRRPAGREPGELRPGIGHPRHQSVRSHPGGGQHTAGGAQSRIRSRDRAV